METCPQCGEDLVDTDRPSSGDPRDEVEAECPSCGFEVLVGDCVYVPATPAARASWDDLTWEAA